MFSTNSGQNGQCHNLEICSLILGGTHSSIMTALHGYAAGGFDISARGTDCSISTGSDDVGHVLSGESSYGEMLEPQAPAGTRSKVASSRLWHAWFFRFVCIFHADFRFSRRCVTMSCFLIEHSMSTTSMSLSKRSTTTMSSTWPRRM